MTPTSGESKTCHRSSRTRAPRNLRPSAGGKTSSTIGQSQTGQGGPVGLEEGLGATSGCKVHPHPLVRWKTFYGNLLLYQQRLEAALETHTLSSELDDLTEQIREKVGSEKSPGARSWQWHGVSHDPSPWPTSALHLDHTRSPPRNLMRSVLHPHTHLCSSQTSPPCLFLSQMWGGSRGQSTPIFPEP